jgi:hypothetical protein
MSSISRPKGFILHESGKRVIIATLESSNTKTGNMVQIWILGKQDYPHIMAANGSDGLVCGDCKLRPSKLGVCYVTLFQGPRAVYQAWLDGSYPFLAESDYGSVFADRQIRFGAYGDPAFVPINIIRSLAESCNGFTGYTHQWHRCNPNLLSYVMASVDDISEKRQANAKGYRTFRVIANGAQLETDEILCPSSRVQCKKCLLCAGKSRQAKNIAIVVHGIGASKFAA